MRAPAHMRRTAPSSCNTSLHPREPADRNTSGLARHHDLGPARVVLHLDLDALSAAIGYQVAVPSFGVQARLGAGSKSTTPPASAAHMAFTFFSNLSP